MSFIFITGEPLVVCIVGFGFWFNASINLSPGTLDSITSAVLFFPPTILIPFVSNDASAV